MIDATEIAEWNTANAKARTDYLGTITDDDPRHGSVAGYAQHIRGRVPPCSPCRIAQTRYLKRWKMMNLSGQKSNLDATGTRRRVQALMRLGWSLNTIAELAGVGAGTVSRIANGLNPTVWRRVADSIAEVYDELHLTTGPAAAVARRAAGRGWAPPLAWDDIDRDEKPQGVRRVS